MPPPDPEPRFSLVIPAYDEEAFLPRLLDSVEVARAGWPGGPDALEVIVADNASTDATARIATDRGCRVVRVEERVIAAARGDVLCFVDAVLDGAWHHEAAKRRRNSSTSSDIVRQPPSAHRRL